MFSFSLCEDRLWTMWGKTNSSDGPCCGNPDTDLKHQARDSDQSGIQARESTKPDLLLTGKFHQNNFLFFIIFSENIEVA